VQGHKVGVGLLAKHFNIRFGFGENNDFFAWIPLDQLLNLFHLVSIV